MCQSVTVTNKLRCIEVRSSVQGMLWNGMENGMEWKVKIGMEYMEFFKYGMEYFNNGMEKIFHSSIHFPYLLTLLMFRYYYSCSQTNKV